jgi:hypothetical protein
MNKLSYSLFNSYINSDYTEEKNNTNIIDNDKLLNLMSMKKTFISNPEIKKSTNMVNITIYTFNKQKLIILKNLLKLNKDILIKKNFLKKNIFSLYNYNNNVYSFYKLFSYFFFNKKNLNIKILIRNILKDKLKNIYLYKYYTNMLYFNYKKYSVNNMLGIINILSKYFNMKVIINVINLKYLFLDNSILTNAIVTKLYNRKNRVLKVIRKIFKLTKKITLQPDIYKKIIYKNLNRKNKFNLILGYNNLLKKNITILNRSYILKDLKNKYLIGLKLQGSGRLTRRLTASRSLSKTNITGTLKNITTSYQRLAAVMLKGYIKSNLQYLNVNLHNRNGSFGIKS